MHRIIQFILVFIFSSAALAKPLTLRENLFASLATPTEWKQRAWTLRAVRLLRGGEEVSSLEELNRLAALPREQLIDELMADPRFGDAVLDFNLYWMGFKFDSLKDKLGRYQTDIENDVFQYAQAIQSAQNTLNNQNYFALFQPNAPLLIPQLNNFVIVTADGPQTDPDAYRKHLIAKRVEETDKLIETVKNQPNMTKQQFCEIWFNIQPGESSVFIGIGAGVGMYLNFILSQNGNDVDLMCFLEGPLPQTPLLELVTQSKKSMDAFVGVLMDKHTQGYQPHNVHEMETFKIGDRTLQQGPMSYYPAKTLPNSSTNFNRKRASYFLRRFFCDELTGIAVEDIPTHTADKHGSQPACYACHYKLDPMAGFFRNYGIFFADFGMNSSIVLDDRVTVKRDAYEQNWLEQTNPQARKFNIGYVRSASSQALNTYGENIDDLYHMLRTLPEVRSCLVQRLFQYTNTEDQSVEGGYLKQVTEQFNKLAEVNSAQAFKQTLKTFLLGKTFNTQNPSPESCYDYSSNFDPENSPPCRISYVIDKNCTSCHNSKEMKGQLNLTAWITLPDGSKSFWHKNKQGEQRSKSETLGRIVERITSTELDRRMPLFKDMSAQDRNALFGWAQQEMQTRGAP